jgi:hypothetical protein
MKNLILTLSSLLAIYCTPFAQNNPLVASIHNQLTQLNAWVEDMEGAAGREVLQSIENTEDLWIVVKNMGISPDKFKNAISTLTKDMLSLAKEKRVNIGDDEAAISQLFEDFPIRKTVDKESEKGPFHCYDQFEQGLKVAALTTTQTSNIASTDMASLVFLKSLVQVNEIFDSCILENY